MGVDTDFLFAFSFTYFLPFRFCFVFGQKLTALKKAYADIILNTAKEAAARIMVSERKAQRYQRELFAAKDESLRMLLRLKQMLDSKVKPFSFSHFTLVVVVEGVVLVWVIAGDYGLV